MNWALLPKSSKAIFPVIACYCNKEGRAFPGELTIGILSGLSKKQVRQGINGLKGFPDITVYDNKRLKRFDLKLPKESIKGKTFPFYQIVLEYGLWRELKSTAKALYPVMRCLSKFDLEIYLDIEGDEERCYLDFDEVYKDRKYDMCQVSRKQLAEYAGIHRNSIESAFVDLYKNYLIEWNSEWNCWKVYLQSKDNTYWKRKYLNKKIRDPFRYILD